MPLEVVTVLLPPLSLGSRASNIWPAEKISLGSNLSLPSGPSRNGKLISTLNILDPDDLGKISLNPAPTLE
jgi:hypothetical protein